MLSVRHSRASGRLEDDCWEFRGNRVFAFVKMGASVLAVDFAICSKMWPVFGAHPIQRSDGETWIVLPLRFVRAWPNGIEAMLAMPCPIADVLTPGDSLALTQCPADVTERLEDL